jgi:uncharacterized protein
MNEIIAEYFAQIYPLIAAITSMILSQIIKIIYSLYKNKNLCLRQAFVSGGMPSSHSAMVISLTTAIGLKEGFSSALFFICMVFSSVVLYDASGVRRAAGNQAAVLNQIIDDLVAKGKFKPQKLQELLGHTPLEVVAGIIFGIIVAFALKP